MTAKDGNGISGARVPPRGDKKSEQTQRMKEHLCKSTIWCLDKYGYSATSIGKITERAQVSRGALTHHYSCKEDLIVDVINHIADQRAAVPWLHSESVEEVGGQSPTDEFEQNLNWSWRQYDTAEGRALIEVILASRTDMALNRRLQSKMKVWDDKGRQLILGLQNFPKGQEEQVLRLWDIARIFYRGLMVHQCFEADRERGNRALSDLMAMLAGEMANVQKEEE